MNTLTKIVFIKVAPQITPFDFGFGDEPANTGDVAGIQCMVARGDLPIDIFWSLNSVPIVTGQNSFTITRMNVKTSSLNIESLDAKHRGNYSCVARNKAGFAEFHTELQVNGLNISKSCYIKIYSLCFSVIIPKS